MFNTMHEMHNDIEKFRKLERNWDSYDGLPPTENAIESICKVVNELEDGRIFATPSGGFSVEFENFDIDISEDGTIKIRSNDED